MATTPEYDYAVLVAKTVKDAQARSLLYQAQVNLRLFTFASEKLDEELEALNAEDFARANTCHMMEGIFADIEHTAQMESHKQAVIALLLTTVSAGHRLTRALFTARRRDGGQDWKTLRYDFKGVEAKYHKVRNFLEHLDEAIAGAPDPEAMGCTFSRGGVLTWVENGTSMSFDFTKRGLEPSVVVFRSVIGLLARRAQRERED